MNNVIPSSRLAHTLLPALVAVFAAACQSTAAPPTQPSTMSGDTALTRQRATAALVGIAEGGAGCRDFALVSSPIAVMHLEDPKAQQTAGRATFASWDAGGERNLEGAAVATIVGMQPSGELLGNHHLLFAEGTLRSQNDVIALAPTTDPCVFNAKVKMIYRDGSGEFAGYSGAGVAEAKLNFCGAPGRAEIYGRICR